MSPKHFQNKARREWWSIHIEAWQRSGLSQRRYCAQHRLTETTFVRWRRALTDAKVLQTKAELLRGKRRERRRKSHIRLSTDMRSKAVQAYWAMHLEAMTWCGMSAQAYAKAHRLSLHSLKRWRSLLEAGKLQIDWRAHLHPSALPQTSTSAKTSAKEQDAELSLTTASDREPQTTEKQFRRSFSDKEKLAIVLETERHGETVSSIARKHGLVTSMLFRWRAELSLAKRKRAKLASVALVDGRTGSSSAPLVLNNLLQPPIGMMTVELHDGRRVFAPEGSDPEAVWRHIAEQETTR